MVVAPRGIKRRRQQKGTVELVEPGFHIDQRDVPVRFEFVSIERLLGDIVDAADPRLLPFEAGHAVEQTITRCRHYVGEYRRERNDSRPVLSLIRSENLPRNANALQTLGDLFPFSARESVLHIPQKTTVVTGVDAMLVRELDVQNASALGIATCIRETIGRSPNPPSFALGICQELMRASLSHDTSIDAKWVCRIWQYAAAYLIACAEHLDTRTSRFSDYLLTDADGMPPAKRARMCSLPKEDLQPALRVVIGGDDDFRTYKPGSGFADYRFFGMNEPSQWRSAMMLGAVPDLVIVMIAAVQGPAWQYSSPEEISAYVHDRILSDRVDVFSRYEAITMRHAILALVLGSNPHILHVTGLEALEDVCRYAASPISNCPCRTDVETVLQWVEGEWVFLSENRTEAWSEIPEPILQMIYHVVFSWVAFYSIHQAMTIIDGIRLRNPPEVVHVPVTRATVGVDYSTIPSDIPKLKNIDGSLRMAVLASVLCAYETLSCALFADITSKRSEGIAVAITALLLSKVHTGCVPGLHPAFSRTVNARKLASDTLPLFQSIPLLVLDESHRRQRSRRAEES